MTKTWIIAGIGLLVLITAICSILLWQSGQDFFANKRGNSLNPQLSGSPIPTQSINETPNIIVTSPKAHQQISLPIYITGKARVFENQLQYRLIECDGNIIRQDVASAHSPDMGLFGPFEVKIDIIPDPEGEYGCLEVFSASPKDGSDINIVNVPIRFDVTKARTVYVYFSTDKTGEDCQTVFPVTRYASSTPEIARVTLEELLRGPSTLEKQQGYQSSINPGVSIRKLTIQNGVARVDFDKQLEEAVGGSCRVSVIRSQITKTLMQFSTIKEVIISIDGRTEDILQP